MNIQNSGKVFLTIVLAAVLAGVLIWRFGLRSDAQTAASQQAVTVKAMQVMQRDTPVNSEFVGVVKSKSEVKIMSKVAGNIVAKMVNGGDTVVQGQPLFRIDNKQYQSAVNSAQASLRKAQSALNNTQREVVRYRKLASIDGVARQTLDTYEAQAEQDAADVAACQATLQQALEDEADTLIVSPVNGRIDINDLNIGDYAAAGSTVLATVASMDPVWVQFSMSENEYLDFAQQGKGSLPDELRDNLKLTLGNGTEYPLSGRIEQIDKGIDDATGTITMKALFDNPDKLLIPGMFAKVTAQGAVRKGAILIPQRAVKELLDSTTVIVVKEDNTAESRTVKLGEKIGNLWIVKDGLQADERIIVEGIDKVKQGTTLSVSMIGPDDLSTAAEQ